VKVLAIIDVAPNANMDRIRAELRDQLKGSWSLFSAGVLREAYATVIPTRVVFVLEAGSVTEADERLRALPLIAAGLLRAELVELRPFVNWSMLFSS
jgi:hypothetical protein